MSTKKTDEQFDSFFRDQLLGSEKEPSFGEWEKLAPVVKKNNFFTVGIHHFNFYYLLTAVAFLASVTFFLYSTKTDIPSKTPLEKVNPTTSSVDSKNILPDPVSAEEKKLPEIKSDRKKQNAAIETPEAIIQDSTGNTTTFIPIPEPLVVEEEKPQVKVPKVKKIITVIEQDTVIKKDTIKTRKKPKQK